ncbi:MAG: hypothetical protein JWM57_4401, partial [Phycisphaerales bacterium]|nr:hypothetical protein [Phycisphaerales bacterium]
MKLPRKHGFTLVELLVVIGIIALLISILLPTLNRARAEAKRAMCLSNLRTLGQCYLEYLTENKGKGLIYSYQGAAPSGATGISYFWFASKTSYSGSVYVWDINQGYLTKFYKNPAFLNCPEASDQFKGFSGGLSQGTVPLTSYGYNANIAGLATSTRIKNSSETCALMDAMDFANDTTGTMVGTYVVQAPSLTSSGVVGFKSPGFHGRHAGKGSVLWYDGHASSEAPYITTLDANLSSGSRYATANAKLTMRRAKIGYLTP